MSIVPLFKSKGDNSECLNYRGMSIFSVFGKLCGRVVIQKVVACMGCIGFQTGEEQCWSRSNRCVD